MTCVTACSADSCGNHRFHIGNVDSVAGNLVAVHVNQQAGLSQFANYSKVGEAADLGERVLDLDGLVLQDI